MTKNQLSMVFSVLLVLISAARLYLRMHEKPKETQYRPATPVHAQRNTEKFIPGGVVLTKDKQGHFRGTVLINNVPMPFLIDTGATQTAIPVALANQAQLPIGPLGQTETANGSAVVLDTEIESLKIGNAEIRNTEASILFNLDEVLIGMNTLKYFEISITNNTMTMMSRNTEPVIMANESEPNEYNPEPHQTKPKHEPRAPAQHWKKNVTCDSQGLNCKTAYSK